MALETEATGRHGGFRGHCHSKQKPPARAWWILRALALETEAAGKGMVVLRALPIETEAAGKGMVDSEGIATRNRSH